VMAWNVWKTREMALTDVVVADTESAAAAEVPA
jgi:hypothetical protein